MLTTLSLYRLQLYIRPEWNKIKWLLWFIIQLVTKEHCPCMLSKCMALKAHQYYIELICHIFYYLK